jgi:hypothetical protein
VKRNDFLDSIRLAARIEELHAAMFQIKKFPFPAAILNLQERLDHYQQKLDQIKKQYTPCEDSKDA